ncbi:hypothetical protein BDV93DRAFT_38838 [Ceratobasidium sp. AG-I]|nr:hypothetical protein BDV93DRAFT_38838 [Ceratobasidium sp. AG-I]
MPDTIWYAIYCSDAFATVSTSMTEIEEALERYPHARVKWCVSFEEGCRWLGERQSQPNPPIQPRPAPPDSPRSERLRRSHPYTVPAFPMSPQRRMPNREIALGRLQGSSSHTTSEVPGAFPTEQPASPGLSLDLEYEYDDDTDLDLYDSDESTYGQLGRETLESGPSTSRTEHFEEAAESDSSLEDMYSAEDFPSGDEFAYADPPTPTSPSSSQLELPRPTTPSTPPTPPSAIDAILEPAVRPLDIQLSPEQQAVLNKVLAGDSVFFTGSAGTGKSVLLRAIVQALGGPSDAVAVTASTGVAAANIGGKTLHAFAGVGLGNQKIDVLIKKAMNDFVATRWQDTNTLIIDEISMVDARWFDVLEAIARSTRRNKKPFGGIQVTSRMWGFFPTPARPGSFPSSSRDSNIIRI